MGLSVSGATLLAADGDVTEADVVMVDERETPGPLSFSAMAKSRRGFGMSIGPALWLDGGGAVRGLAKEVGFDSLRRFPRFWGSHVHAWFAVNPNVRVGIWGDRISSDVREPFETPAGDTVQTLDVRQRRAGVSVSGVWPRRRSFLYGGAGLGVGTMRFRVGRVQLGAPDNFDDFSESLRNDSSSRTFERGFRGTGPGGFLRLGGEFQVLAWLSIGAETGWHFFAVPSGGWTDTATDGRLVGAGGRWFQGWGGRAFVTVGFFPRDDG